MNDQLLTIGELSRRSGVAVSAVRYYEELGLMLPALRVSGKRRYDASAVGLVGMILFLRDIGFSLGEMQTLMESRSSSSGAWRDLTQAKLAELEERIARDQAARVALQHALQCQHEELLDCPNFASVVAGRLAGQPLEEAHTHSRLPSARA